MKRSLIVIAAVVVIQPGMLGGQDPSAGLNRSPAAVVRWEPYVVEVSDGQGVQAERGHLTVPERRGSPNTRTIKLAIIRLSSTADRPGPPIVYLGGSPGSIPATSELRVPRLLAFFQRLRGAGDVLLLDYRGTGLSSPRLDCPANPDPPADLFVSRTHALRWVVANARRCAQAMRQEGVDLAGYTWTEVASDVQDLRQALRMPSINLVGFSSGTHAILATLRAHPAGIGRVVLIGTEGPDHTRKLPANIDRQLDRIDRLVSEDVELRREVPDFLGLMRRVLDRSERTPFEVVVKLSNGTARMQVGKFALQYITARSLSGPDEFGRLPLLYLTLNRGDTRMLTQMMQRIVSRPQSNPLASVMDGASGVSSERWARIEREAAGSPLGNAVNFPFPEIGKIWRYADLGPSYRAPLTSDIRALFVTGELDGNTPTAQAEEVRDGFPNSVHLVIANGGHGSPITSSDAADAVVAFLLGNDVGAVRIVAPAGRFARSVP